MARTPRFPAINTTTEWVAATADLADLGPAGKAAGELVASFRLISAADVQRETEKAIGVKGTRWNSCANPNPTIVWFPKSQVKELTNDFWANCAPRMFLLPAWLVNAKDSEGLEIH